MLVVKEISVLGNWEGIDEWIFVGDCFESVPGASDLRITLIQE
jgi:hypothetical protein